MRLVGESTVVVCPTCNGRGRIPSPQAFTRQTVVIDGVRRPINAPSNGHPIPCPQCRGRKTVVS